MSTSSKCDKPRARLTYTHSHCGACKQMSGGAFTLNQIIPRTALQFTKGEDNMSKYTYKGDSGTFSPLP